MGMRTAAAHVGHTHTHTHVNWVPTMLRGWEAVTKIMYQL